MSKQSVMIFQLRTGFGVIAVIWTSHGLLSRVEWVQDKESKFQSKGIQWPIPTHVVEWMERFRNYFDKGEPFGEIPWEWIDQEGWTPFQSQVYRTIVTIPHGETRTYGWVASRMGRLAATRAVGQSLRNNPIPILIPCHRVVSVTSLGGFMGTDDPNQPELILKRQLISVEEEYRNPVFSFLPARTQIPVLGEAV